MADDKKVRRLHHPNVIFPNFNESIWAQIKFPGFSLIYLAFKVIL
jgi:hypothetical protein